MHRWCFDCMHIVCNVCIVYAFDVDYYMWIVGGSVLSKQDSVSLNSKCMRVICA